MNGRNLDGEGSRLIRELKRERLGQEETNRKPRDGRDGMRGTEKSASRVDCFRLGRTGAFWGDPSPNYSSVQFSESGRELNRKI